MKKIILFLFIFSTFILMAQKNKNQKIEKVGNLFEVTIYYDNGNVMQHGFLSKDNKLHASWESYNEDGSRKCVAVYNHGVKTGTWYYWNGDKRTKVVYKENEIINVKELDSVQH